MPANYVLLEKITVGAAGASSVTFSGIPQTGYTDLVVKWSARSDKANKQESVYVNFNSSTTGFTSKWVGGDGSAAYSLGTSTVESVGFCVASTMTANTFSSTEMYIPNYTSSNYKSFSVDWVDEGNQTTVYNALIAGLWSNTAAITSIKLYPAANNFVANSTFYLYGVAKLGTTPAIVPYATGGDTIMTDGTYWYHAFKSSGTFTPAKGLSCDVLVVAGGGAGGSYAGGGGGAGGLLLHTSQSLASGTGYTATIGAGGSGAVGITGNVGSNSTFASLTASVGGGGGGIANGNATSGGSGGGGSYNKSGASATSGQGNAGGTSSYGAGIYPAAGGGGAGAVGGNTPDASTAGAGGAGVNTYSSWASATGTGVSGYYAGGGGGSVYYNGGGTAGAGGSGGGGAGGVAASGAANVGSNGTANTGGGGGGASTSSPSGTQVAGGNGGSGIVIVRYAV